MEAALENGITEDERLDFIREINYKQQSFREKMKRIKQIEQKKREKKYRKGAERFEKQKKFRAELAAERLHNSQNAIKLRQIQREEAALEYKEYRKVHNITKFGHERIEEQYQRKVLDPRREQERRLLERIKKKNQPIDFTQLNDHTRQYDAQKKIQYFKFREKYGMDFYNSPPQQTQFHSNFESHMKNKERDLKYMEALRRNKTRMKYGEEVSFTENSIYNQ